MALVTSANCNLKLKEYTCLANYEFYMKGIDDKLHNKRTNY